MNIFVIRILLFLSLGIVIAGEIERRRPEWYGGDNSTSMIGAVFCLIFSLMHISHNLSERRIITLGSETLPPISDVASVLVHGKPISEGAKKTLLKAISKARRSSVCKSLSIEIPFQIVDRWGGTWDLEAYEDVAGNRGFSISRVYYSGTSARIVAECVGLDSLNNV